MSAALLVLAVLWISAGGLVVCVLALVHLLTQPIEGDR